MNKIVPITLLLLLVAVPTAINAQSACTDQVAGKTRAQLEQELEACNQEIAQWTAELNKAKQSSASFQRDVTALTAKINAAQANIKGKNIAITNLTKDIVNKEREIVALDERVERVRESIGDMIRRTSNISSYSLVEAVLSDKEFSEFFADIDTYASTEIALSALIEELRGTKTQVETEKADLAKKREQEASARAALEAAKREVERDQAAKKSLLAQSQSNERAYSQVVADRQAKAAQIRATLFPLRDAGAIQFGTALQYAEFASTKTGVRPALILAILQQESALGANVGSCVITNLTSGQTKNVNTGRLYANGIHPTRDLPILQTLLPTLGRNPLDTKVSCPLNIGYGGAMGPAQFIPSTWNLIKNRVASNLGKTAADPWSPQDAIMASALLLKDLGAASGAYADERNAACRYYSGRTCSALSAAATYGNQVMAKATNIQNNMINLLAAI